MPVAFDLLRKMLWLDGAPLTLPLVDGPAIFALLPLILLLLSLGQLVAGKFPDSLPKLSPSKLVPLKAAYVAILICLLMVLSPDATPRFVYFQF